MWIYRIDSDEFIQYDDHGVLIDCDVSKVFWAENQKDMVLVYNHEYPVICLLESNPSSTELFKETELEELSSYITEKQKVVKDLLREDAASDSNEGEAKGCEEFYKEFILLFKRMIYEERVLCKMSGEAGVEGWKHRRYIFGSIVACMKEAGEKHHFDCLVEYSDVPPDLS